MTRTEQWRSDRLGFIRALKKPSEHQLNILQLVDNAIRTTRQNRELASLWKEEQRRVRSERNDMSAYRKTHPLGPTPRKARDHRLIQLGALVEIAGLIDLDRGTLLGGLIAMKEHLARDTGEQKAKLWKSFGDDTLMQRELARQKRQANRK